MTQRHGRRSHAHAPAVVALLFRRELDRTFAAVLVLAAALAVVVAHSAASALDAATPLERLLRRYDFTALAVLLFIAVLRIASRVETDTRDGWLDAFVAAGTSRTSYGLGVGAAVFAAAGLVFAVTAVTFAAAVARFAGSAELLHRLPVTLAGGALLLLHWCAFAMLIALLTRRTVPAFMLTALPVLALQGAMTLQLMRDHLPSTLLVRATRTLPGVMAAFTPAAVVWSTFGVLTCAALAHLVSTRLTGRRP